MRPPERARKVMGWIYRFCPPFGILAGLMLVSGAREATLGAWRAGLGLMSAGTLLMALGFLSIHLHWVEHRS